LLHWTICRKYMIKRLIHYLFHIIPAIIPRLISTFHCVSGWYGGLWMLPGLIWKRSCINLYVFTHTSVQDKFHIKWCLYRLIVTPRVIRVEQKLLTLPEHLSSLPDFSGVRVTRTLFWCEMFCRSLFIPLSSFILPLHCLSSFDLRHLLHFNPLRIFKVSVIVGKVDTLYYGPKTSTHTRLLHLVFMLIYVLDWQNFSN
jgi:hypothetical protein